MNLCLIKTTHVLSQSLYTVFSVLYEVRTLSKVIDNDRNFYLLPTVLDFSRSLEVLDHCRESTVGVVISGVKMGDLPCRTVVGLVRSFVLERISGGLKTGYLNILLFKHRKFR